MKAMKKLKSMKKSKIGRKHMVFNGLREKTSGGLTKDKLTKNKAGKIVSKAMSQQAKKTIQKQLAVGTKLLQKHAKSSELKDLLHSTTGRLVKLCMQRRKPHTTLPSEVTFVVSLSVFAGAM